MNNQHGTFLDPEQLIQDIGVIRSGMRIADFGCGAGFITLSLARAVGRSGTVVAIDVQQQVLNVVESSAKREGLFQIKTVWADLERPRGSRLRDGEMDFVMIANVLFQSGRKDAIVREARRVLRPKGFLALVEWMHIAPGGPPIEQRIMKPQLRALVEQEKFILVKEFPAGKYHYGLLFEH